MSTAGDPEEWRRLVENGMLNAGAALFKEVRELKALKARYELALQKLEAEVERLKGVLREVHLESAKFEAELAALKE